MVAPTNYYLGVDPGKSGGLAVLKRHGKTTSIVRLTEMPDTETNVWRWIESASKDYTDLVASIELVHSMPRQGVSSTFKFGTNYGFLRGCLVAAGISFREVLPRVWQKRVGVTKRKDSESQRDYKVRLMAKSQQLFPKADINLRTADALLIALYCLESQD